MRNKKVSGAAIMLGVFCTLSMAPCATQGADLIIGNNVSTSGNWALSGGITASSLSGSGSGLTNVTAANLVCTGCVSPSELSFIPGTITGVTAGTGLTGGGSSGAISLAVNFDGSGMTTSAARSDHNHDALYLGKYSKVAIVAQNGGDYFNPLSAMEDSGSWCGTASESNPCLVKIMPGAYDVGSSSVQMKDYIDIEGSGENTTKIKGNISNNSSGVVRGATFAELRFLSVENVGGGGADAIAMYNYQAAPKITNVTLTARNGGRHSIALYNTNLSLPVLTNVTLEGFDAANKSIGIVSNTLCNPQLNNVKIKALGGPANYGVWSESYVVTIISNSSIEVTGTSSNWAIGVITTSSSSLQMSNTSVEAKSGSLNIGVQNGNDGGNVTIDRSSIVAANASIRNDSSTASFSVGASKIDGPIQGSTVCVSSYNGSYVARGTDCR